MNRTNMSQRQWKETKEALENMVKAAKHYRQTRA